MSRTSVIIAGVLTAAVALGVYMHFSSDGAHDQKTAVANQERIKPSQQPSAPPQTSAGPQRGAAPQPSTPPRTFTEAAPVVPTSPPPTAESAPAHPVHRQRTGATPSTQPAERMAFSKVERNPRAPQSRSDVATQNKPAPSPPAVVPPASSGEQFSQRPNSSSEAPTENKAAETTAALQPPSSSSTPSLSVQPVVAPFAMLHATGKILLNGKLSDESVISSGESIETPPDTYATLVRENSEVLIRPNSRLKITERGVELDRGEVQVTTTTGLPVQAKNLTITPSANGPAKYEVLDSGESTRVLTHEGSVLVKEGNAVAQPN